MTREQYEIIRESLLEDIEKIQQMFADDLMTGETADYEERAIYEQLAELERDYTEQTNC